MTRSPPHAIAMLLLMAPLSVACETPVTYVAFANQYSATATPALVIYRAFWQAVAFADPIVPGATSAAQSTVPATDNIAYVALAPGWDATQSAAPTRFTLLQSNAGFTANLHDTLRIDVNDDTFTGNCAAHHFLSQAQADFIIERVFAADLGALLYDAATCSVTPTSDAGAP